MKLYALYIVLKDADKTRLAKFVPDLKTTIDSFGGNELAFRSAAGDVFGFFLQTDRAAAEIRAAVERQQTFLNGDVVVVCEMGRDFSAIGNSRAWAWAQHRLPKAP